VNALWIHRALSLALPIALVYVLYVYQRRDGERFYSAYRLALKFVLVCLLLALIPQVRAYADLVIRTARGSRSLAARQRKMRAADLESSFARANRSAARRLALQAGGP
jgi:hypothetical protein